MGHTGRASWDRVPQEDCLAAIRVPSLQQVAPMWVPPTPRAGPCVTHRSLQNFRGQCCGPPHQGKLRLGAHSPEGVPEVQQGAPGSSWFSKVHLTTQRCLPRNQLSHDLTAEGGDSGQRSLHQTRELDDHSAAAIPRLHCIQSKVPGHAVVGEPERGRGRARGPHFRYRPSEGH